MRGLGATACIQLFCILLHTHGNPVQCGESKPRKSNGKNYILDDNDIHKLQNILVVLNVWPGVWFRHIGKHRIRE